MLFSSHVFFQKPEFICCRVPHAVQIEQTKNVRQFKDLLEIPVAEVSKMGWENFSIRMLLGSQFQRKLPDFFSFSQASNRRTALSL